MCVEFVSNTTARRQHESGGSDDEGRGRPIPTASRTETGFRPDFFWYELRAFENTWTDTKTGAVAPET
jgi:hypothetical protein